MLYLIIKFFEWSAATIPFLGWAYLKINEQVVLREAMAANIKREDRVLHIGCGSFPYTALLLAQRYGARVTAIDHDSTMAAKAQLFVTRHGVGELVRVFCLDGLEAISGSFDVIILSLGVRGRESILQKILSGGERGTRIVVIRVPRLWGRFYATDVAPKLPGYTIIRHCVFSPRSSIVHVVA